MQPLAEHVGQVWDCSFLAAATSYGEHIEILAIIDGQTRECLAILVEHDIGSQEVTDRLSDLFAARGAPECIRSGNAPYLLVKAVGDWLGKTGIKTRFVKRGESRQSDRAESFGRRLRDDLIDGRTFTDLREARAAIGGWRRLYSRTSQPEPTGDEADTCQAPRQQSSSDREPHPPQSLRRQGALEDGASRSVKSHDPIHDEIEANQSVQRQGSLDRTETGQSVERQGLLGAIEAAQTDGGQGSPGVIETGQTDERQGSLGAIGTGQSVERQSTPDVIDIGLSVQHDGPPDEIQAGQSVQRHGEIEIDQSVRRRGPLDEIVAGQSVQPEGPINEVEASPFVQRQGPLDEIVTGQSVQHQVSVDDEAGTRRPDWSRRAVTAVIGLVAPSLRPVSSRRHRMPTVRETKRTMVRATEWIGITVVILLVTVVALTLIAPYFGWRVDTVRSGSMEPELKVGSVVITRPVQAEEVSVGDVITFRSPTSGEIASRRVSAIEDGPSFRTEGIANGDADPFVTPAQGVVGRVCFHLPFAGYVIQHLVTPVGMLLLFVFGFSIVVSEMISMFQLRWRQPA